MNCAIRPKNGVSQTQKHLRFEVLHDRFLTWERFSLCSGLKDVKRTNCRVGRWAKCVSGWTHKLQRELHVRGGRGTAHPSNLAGTGQHAIFFPLAASFKVHKMYSSPLSCPLTKSSHPKFLIFIPEAWTSTHTVITLSLENSRLEKWAFLVLLRHWNFWVQHHQMLWEKQGQ